MHRPQNNPSGYDNSTISDVAAMGENTRFLIMHGVADDNVHYQNTLTLLDKLNLQNIDNWDMVMYPDSDHSIYFHNAHTIVYERKFEWSLSDGKGYGLTFHRRLVELAHQRVQWRVAPHCQPQARGVILEADQALCSQSTIICTVIFIHSSTLVLGRRHSGVAYILYNPILYSYDGITSSKKMHIFIQL